MIRLRPYKLSDSEYIVNWFNDEVSFMKWCAGKFTYPLTKEQLEEYYHKYEKDDNAWIMTAINEDGVPVGHILMRMADYRNESIHFGFIVVDSNMRGHGYGGEMVSLAVKYAFEILKVKRVTLIVFDNNNQAHCCYRTAGFADEKYIESDFPYKDEKWGTYHMAMAAI
jgi:RimJ/RimL family protein N-acetyltransferase